MNRKEEFRKFIGNGLPKEHFDLGLTIWSTMKEVLARKREKKRVLRFKRKLEGKGVIARQEALLDIRDRLKNRQSGEKRKRLSEDRRKDIARLLKKTSNET